jgi:hypothetical protein
MRRYLLYMHHHAQLRYFPADSLSRKWSWANEGLSDTGLTFRQLSDSLDAY